MCGRETKTAAVLIANLAAVGAAIVYLMLFRSSDALTLASAAILLNAFPVILLLER
jgi:hypothetical protein